MELRRYLHILWRRALLIGLTMVVAVVVAEMNTNRTALYTATSTLYVGASQFNFGQNPQGNLSDPNAGLPRVILTFATMVDSIPIAQDAIDLTGVPRSAAAVIGATQASPIPETNILRIAVTDTDPAVAQTLATGMAEAFVRKIAALEPGQFGEGDVPRAPVTIFERATLPTVPQRQAVIPKLIVAGLFGLLAASAAVLLAEYLDITIKTAEDAERKLELPVLAVVPILVLDPNSTLRRRSRKREELGLVRDA